VSTPLPYWRLSAVYLAYFACVGVLQPYLGLYLQSLGQGAAALGALVAAMQLARIVATNGWAWLADRAQHRERVLRAAAAASFVGWLPMLVAEDFVALAVVLAAASFAMGGVVPLTEAIVLARLRDQVGRYGRLRIWGSFGFIVAVTIAGWTFDRLPIGALPRLTGLTLLLVVIAAYGVPPSPQLRASRHESVLPMLRRPEIAAFLLSAFLLQVAHGPLYTFLSIHLAASGWSPSFIGAMWSLGVGAEIVAFLLMPRLLARFGTGPVLLASFALAAVRFAVIGWGSASGPLVVFAQLLHGATFGAHHAAAVAVTARWFAGARQARGQAAYLSISFGAGGMVGGLASGLLWDAVGAAWTFGFGSAAAVLGFAVLAANRASREASVPPPITTGVR
jgi:PPP family 3-phenylpropionic acid transporter